MTINLERNIAQNIICEAEGCSRHDVQGHGLCRMHYFRWRRTGVTTTDRPKRKARGICSVGGCNAVDHGQSSLCSKHELRLKRHRSVDSVLTPRLRSGAENNQWTGSDATYAAVHQRLPRERGKAAKHSCVDCGSQALHWSYDHSDPDEKSSEFGAYSLDLQRYQPRCVPCHKRFDLDAIATTGRGRS